MSPVKFDAPEAVRVRNAWLGGKDAFAPDRDVAERVSLLTPWLPAAIDARRSFLHRGVRLAAQGGVDQFLVLPCGLPVEPYLHDTARDMNPAVRAVHVALNRWHVPQAQAILAFGETSFVVSVEPLTADDTVAPAPAEAEGFEIDAPLAVGGEQEFLDADLTDPAVIDAVMPHALEFLDFCRPVALVLDGALDHVAESEAAAGVLARLGEWLAPGNCVALTHVTADPAALGDRAEPTNAAWEHYNARITPPQMPRSAAEIDQILRGWILPRLGVVPVDLVSATAAATSASPPLPLPVLVAVAVLLCGAQDIDVPRGARDAPDVFDVIQVLDVDVVPPAAQPEPRGRRR